MNLLRKASPKTIPYKFDYDYCDGCVEVQINVNACWECCEELEHELMEGEWIDE